jgi:hypothetical protein
MNGIVRDINERGEKVGEVEVAHTRIRPFKEQITKTRFDSRLDGKTPKSPEHKEEGADALKFRSAM